jgi:diguanylate cyclase (GGDEF)-like protein
VSTDAIASNCDVPELTPTLALYVGALALGVLCMALFVLAIRRMLDRQEEVVTTMLQRYDHRLAEFAQTLSDALNQTLPARISAAISGTPVESPSIDGPDHANVVRVLELAREQTSADAAVAIVGTQDEPILATVGLSQAEVNQVGGLSVPDYRGARAIQVSFNSDDAPHGNNPPIRSGLAVPLMDSPTDPGMLAVLTRTPDRRFSELDITSLENVLSIGRPALETSLEKREPDPVPERDPLTDLYDRPAFHALLDLEIARARGRREQLALLVLDVDRLTTINARIGHLAADDVLAILARVLNDVASPRDLSCRIGGGRFGVILSQGDSRDAEALFDRLQSALRERPLPNLGVVSFSGGVAELLPKDDATALIVRADAALGLAKSSGRDMAVTAAKRPNREVA